MPNLLKISTKFVDGSGSVAGALTAELSGFDFISGALAFELIVLCIPQVPTDRQAFLYLSDDLLPVLG